MFMAAIWIVNVIFSVLENPEKGGPFRPNDLLWNARLPLGYYLVPATTLHRVARSRPSVFRLQVSRGAPSLS
ncbi:MULTISPECIES: hypothetical protein [Mameliella]|uniref:hypothetical protein n=1 Tax=Mameliella TaxID=1434019 RepID=UPI000B537C37|nr:MULTISPECIES: hypothetical protein [Mameliella]MCR9273716.1 hypothetical protein [Paracoccaceae bacterium]OWV56756.1 hypothetical protein CDZ98_17200 [Mameliella alba]